MNNETNIQTETPRPVRCSAWLGGSSSPKRKVSPRVLAYRLRYLTEQMTELAHEIGDSDANTANILCSELLVMRDNVWFMSKRVLPPNDRTEPQAR